MNIQLAKRAVACRHWRWMEGMKVVAGPRLWRDLDGPFDAWPDLDDPATLGCLLELVRDKWMENGRIWLSWDEPFWKIHPEIGGAFWPDYLYGDFTSEQEALIVALEAAP